MSKVKARSKVLDVATYENGLVSNLQLVDNATRKKLCEEIKIPLAIMFRLYHLGRAYDFQSLKLFRPDGSNILDYSTIQNLCAELELLRNIVTDPVIEHYTNVLIPAIQDTKSKPRASLILVTSETTTF